MIPVSLSMAGFRLHQISPVEIPTSPLMEALTWATTNDEEVELWEIRVPGQRPNAHLLHRPLLGETRIAWGADVIVSGPYEVLTALRMFAARLEGEVSFVPKALVDDVAPLIKRGQRRPRKEIAAPVLPAKEEITAPLAFPLTPIEVRVLRALLRSCVAFEDGEMNELMSDEWKVGDHLLERLMELE